MIVTLKQSSSPDNEVNKNISNEFEYSCKMKNSDSVSVVTPTIIVHGDASTFSQYNYARIEAFGRNYFITDIKTVRNNIVEIDLKCDVISTYYSQYKDNACIVNRSASYWNQYYEDPEFPVETRREFDRYTVDTPFSSGGRSCILQVTGGQ